MEINTEKAEVQQIRRKENLYQNKTLK